MMLAHTRASPYPCDARRPHSRHRARARRIQALPPIQTRIPRSRSPPSPWVEARRSRGLPCRGRSRGRGLRNDCNHHGLDEHAVAGRAVEVSLALDAAVVLARLLIELDAYPFANLEVGRARKADSAFAAIGELGRLPRLKIRHYGQWSRSWGIVPTSADGIKMGVVVVVGVGVSMDGALCPY